MRTVRHVLLLLLLVVLLLSSCVGSVSMSIPIGSPYGYGPMGSFTIGSGPIYF